MIDLSGKTAFVTGASRGIGRAVALALARAGADVAVGCLTRRRAAEEVADSVRGLGRRSLVICGDLGRFASAAAAVREIAAAWGRLDILVANAGIWKRCPIVELTEEAWRETVDTNLSSAAFLCRHAVVEMKRRGGGVIVLVSSTAGQRGEAFYSPYAATKGGLIAFTKSLAAELGPHGIRVNAVAPGWVVTDMTREVMEDNEQRRRIAEEIPLGRIAEPEDIAGPILFLVSDLARFVHGEVLNVNGGSVLCG
ncbi:MAG: 3-oxoacyl-[acyl-carrier-protein] reductase [Acidobacteriota bacterium]